MGVIHVLCTHNPNTKIHVHILEDTLGYIQLYRTQHPEYQIYVHYETVKQIPLSNGVIFTSARDYHKKYIHKTQPMVRIGHTLLDKLTMDMGMVSLIHPQWATFSVEWELSHNLNEDSTPMVVLIGLSTLYSSDLKDKPDLIRLIDSGIQVVVFARSMPKDLPHKENTTYYENKSQTFMIDFLQTHNCFIWTAAPKKSKYHQESMTGAVPVAISCNIPLIMDEELHKIYNLPALTYRDSITEVLDEIQMSHKVQTSIYADFVSFQHHKFINILKTNGFRGL